MLPFQSGSGRETLYWQEKGIVKTLSPRFNILGEQQGFTKDTLFLQKVDESLSGRYYCVSNPAKDASYDSGERCFDVLVLPRVEAKFVKPVDGINENGQRVAKGWGDAEGTEEVLPGNWEQYGEVVEFIPIDDPRQTVTLDCTVRCIFLTSMVQMFFNVTGFLTPMHAWNMSKS